MVPCLRVVFRRLVRLFSFPACWRQANVTSIPKGPPFSCVANAGIQPICGYSNQSQHAIKPITACYVDSCRSKLLNIVSGVKHASVLGPLLFLLYTSELFYILENKMIGNANDYI